MAKKKQKITLIFIWGVSIVWVYQIMRMFLANDFTGFLIWGLSFLICATLLAGIYFAQEKLAVPESFIFSITFPLLIIYPVLPYLYTGKPLLGITYPRIFDSISKDPKILETLTLIFGSILVSLILRLILVNITNKDSQKKLLLFVIFIYTISIGFFIFLSGIPEVVKIIKTSNYYLIGSIVKHFSWMKKVLPDEILYGVPTLIGVLLSMYFSEILKPKFEKNN